MMTKSASNDNFHVRPRSGIVHDGSQSRFKNVIKDIHHPQNINSQRNNDVNEFGYSAHGGSIQSSALRDKRPGSSKFTMNNPGRTSDFDNDEIENDFYAGHIDEVDDE